MALLDLSLISVPSLAENQVDDWLLLSTTPGFATETRLTCNMMAAPRKTRLIPRARGLVLQPLATEAKDSAEVVITAHHKQSGPCSDCVNVDEQTENLKSAPISICSFSVSCIGPSYLPSTTDYEIAIVESRRGGVCYARHIPRARVRSPARDRTRLVNRRGRVFEIAGQ
jgi:hypothetical protein